MNEPKEKKYINTGIFLLNAITELPSDYHTGGVQFWHSPNRHLSAPGLDCHDHYNGLVFS
jgi:hypothetical protein